MQAAAEARKPCVAERWPLQLRGGGGVCNSTGCLDSAGREAGRIGSPQSCPCAPAEVYPDRRTGTAPGTVGLGRQRLPSCRTCGKRKAMRPSFQRKSRGLGHKWGLMEELK